VGALGVLVPIIQRDIGEPSPLFWTTSSYLEKDSEPRRGRQIFTLSSADPVFAALLLFRFPYFLVYLPRWWHRRLSSYWNLVGGSG